MSKGIYSLKIYLFRDAFKLSRVEEKRLYEICLFIVFVYIKSWYSCPLAIHAPQNDLNFIKNLLEYESIDSNLVQRLLEKFKNHLWYLNRELSALSFFDDRISIEIKKKMLTSLIENIEIDDDIQRNFQ